MYQGQGITCKKIKHNIAELCFDLKGASVNKFNVATLAELQDVVQRIAADDSVTGLMITSAKESFIVGADITEFLGYFKQSDADLLAWIKTCNRLFCQIEDLDIPTISVLNGIALGGGLELPLATCYRIASERAKPGLPETKLGIIPGWGGTTRLPRLIGADNAIEWITSGKQYRAEEAFRVGVVDALVAPDKLHACAVDMLNRAIQGQLDWRARRAEKTQALKLTKIEAGMVFEVSKAFVGAQAGPHYPAPIAAIEVMQKSAHLARDAALEIEHAYFVKMAKTTTATALVTVFLGDQAIKKAAKTITQGVPPVTATAVLGAGIMGGGIAYQTASKGITIHMKDIAESALTLGFSEAGKLLNKLISLGRLDNPKMIDILNRIRPTLAYTELSGAQVIVEAVVENAEVKQAVLQEVEAVMAEGAILASNTSTISITALAKGLKRPDAFCGMHFFNPVHRMPLVEVIRGEHTSDATIAAVVQYALAMGKSPIVVNDCPGFLVNRVLFPYFGGFIKLLNQGVDFKQIDKVMEQFGWPMGPAYLLDVVGIDTGHHGGEVMAQAYPDRMRYTEETAIDQLYAQQRYGQKNNLGFYQYTLDKKGKPKKQADPSVYALLTPVSNTEISSDEIVDRMMLPMIIESARCLDDNIVESATMLDMALIYGLGFPPFRGGIFHYVDSLGVAEVCRRAEKYAALGPLYAPTASMLEMAKTGQTYRA